ncbi:MAG TPA: DUF2064 domain-containing protein [Nocardioidaceae bacterium]|nr:DUF2064 domain-containing protein [Nocardioidaceae bacterium]
MTTAVLVVAKMPVPGEAKTRLAAHVGDARAAELAAAALLDTLAAVVAADLPCVVALTGDLRRAARRPELESALAATTVVPQRGDTFAGRLTAAHHDTARLLPRHRVLQIGMDTPQVTAGLLDTSARRLEALDAVVGPATDGGWWALGVARPQLTDRLIDVPMSQPDTGRATVTMLRHQRARIGGLAELRDVDTFDDACAVAADPQCGPRFAAAVAELAVDAR